MLSKRMVCLSLAGLCLSAALAACSSLNPWSAKEAVLSRNEAAPNRLPDEDGYELWLRYRPVDGAWLDRYRAGAAALVVTGSSATMKAAQDELMRGLGGLLGRNVRVEGAVERNGTVLVGTPASSPAIAALALPLDRAGAEGFVIRSVKVEGRRATVIAGNTDVGALRGAFQFLALMQTRRPIDQLDIVSAPKLQYRIMDHWDRLDRTVERGYAGFSIWDWHKLPDWLDPRYTDYARASASIGINGVVLNNVNSRSDSLLPQYLEKTKALAGILRPYGIKVYLTARFSAPIEIGGMKTADPLNPQVAKWWKDKADEIYRYIPDFGGFLVKANSEGQPGPQDYKRTHADGANMMADVLGSHGGIVMWRAFVYSNEVPVDRIKQAYNEFVPLDGKFRDNVLIQTKNGPLDFQPREPFHPLFGAMRQTPVMMEFQLTKEYLGFATHLAYLAPMFEEVLKTDTYAKGAGTTVAQVIEGRAFGYKRTGMAAVGNVGDDRNWCGSHFDCANWYAFGRLAWDPEAGSEAIARDWVRMTLSDDPRLVEPVIAMMMGSREAVVDYMTPLGLTHLMATGHHYGPGPWVNDTGRADWNPVYYHRADKNGIGFDRTATGSNAVSQYAPEVAKLYADPDRIPENLLLWFHHVAWDKKMKSGRTLWDELVTHYDRGVAKVGNMRRVWESVRPYVDAARYDQVAAFLAIQEKEAKWWRDASIAYFSTFSGLPLPAGSGAPEHSLDYYKSIKILNAPGRSGN